MSDLPAQPNQSTILAFECLHAVVASAAPIGSREVSRKLSLEPTKVNRLLRTLAHVGMLARTPDRKYRPGPAVHVLAAISLQGSHLLQNALPFARRWWERDFTVTLGVLWRRSLCYLLHAKPDRPFEQSIGGHEVMSAAWSSAGMALLAERPQAEITEAPFEQWDRLVEPVQKIVAQLEQTRHQGYAIRHYREGIVSVGVPVGQPAVAGFSVSRPGLAKKEIESIVQALRDDAAMILSAS